MVPLRIPTCPRIEKGIVLARIFPGESGVHPEFITYYLYADFTKDFEVGFRRVTAQMLGNPYSSWEMIAYAKDDQILDGLERGFIPGLIAKEIVDWVIVEKLWPVADDYASKSTHIYKGTPRTPMGSLRVSRSLIKQFAEQRDALGAYLAQQVSETIEPVLKELSQIKDDEHELAGKLAHRIIMDVKQILNKSAVGFRDAGRAFGIQGYYDFDVTDKIRELVNVHARRSRYLY